MQNRLADIQQDAVVAETAVAALEGQTADVEMAVVTSAEMKQFFAQVTVESVKATIAYVRDQPVR